MVCDGSSSIDQAFPSGQRLPFRQAVDGQQSLALVRRIRMAEMDKKIKLRLIILPDEADKSIGLKLNCTWTNPVFSRALFLNDEKIDEKDANFNTGSTWMAFVLTDSYITSEKTFVKCEVQKGNRSASATIEIHRKYVCIANLCCVSTVKEFSHGCRLI